MRTVGIVDVPGLAGEDGGVGVARFMGWLLGQRGNDKGEEKDGTHICHSGYTKRAGRSAGGASGKVPVPRSEVRYDLGAIKPTRAGLAPGATFITLAISCTDSMGEITRVRLRSASWPLSTASFQEGRKISMMRTLPVLFSN